MKAAVLLLGATCLLLHSSKSFAIGECRNLFKPAEVKNQRTLDARRFAADAEVTLRQLGMADAIAGPLQVYYQEMFLNPGLESQHNKSRVLALTAPIVVSKRESLRIGYVLNIDTMIIETTLVRESIAENGDRYFSTTENTASLLVAPAVAMKGNKEAVRIALDTLESSLLSSFPTFTTNQLVFLGVLNVSAPQETTLAEKLAFVAKLRVLPQIADGWQLGFNARVDVDRGRIWKMPAVLADDAEIDLRNSKFRR